MVSSSSSSDLAAFAELPEHRRLLNAIVDYFESVPGAIGAFIGGSNVRGGMDEHSDLDVGIVFDDDEAREAAWERRREWEIAPWIHAYDADHMRRYFAHFVYESGLVAELPLYTVAELDEATWGGPFAAIWDETGALTEWLGRPEPSPGQVDWSAAPKEDEQFWAWTLHAVKQARRGEWYSVATNFHVMRELLEAWDARLHGELRFDPRRIEQRRDAGRLRELFPRPERDDVKRALIALVDVHARLRERIDAPWRTSAAMHRYVREQIDKI